MNLQSVKYSHVVQAITEFDRLGRDAFLKKYDFGKSRDYFLFHKEKSYDSKAIFGVAHGYATGEFLTHKDFSGGIAAAAGYLQNIGFEIDDALTTEPDGIDRNYWALFANPRIYKIQDAINELSDDLWVTKGRQISLGDRVLIWKGTGDDGWRGVVAFGDVINDPTVTTDSENPYWKNPTDGLSPEERVRVSYVTVPSLPLRYGSAQWDVLNELSISRARGGTVFKVETETWKKLISSAGGWPSETITPSAQSQVRNQKWSREEVILALDIYMRYGLIGEKHPELQNLSNTLRKRVDLTKVASPDKYRNLNGCKMKLANLASLDPGYEGVGLKGGGQLEEEIWNEFAGDQERLSILAAQLRSDPNIYSKPTDDHRSIQITDVEEVHTPEYSVIGSSEEKIATRREQKMVLGFRDYLSNKGHVVKQHVYGKGNSAMRCDLFDETSGVLYEAKGTSHRMSIRLAIGQLFDYRRFEDKEPALAILIPGRPNDEIVDLCNELNIEIVWPVGDTFISTNNSI